MFSMICAWTNGWSNSRDADELRHHCAHCDVTVINFIYHDTYAFFRQASFSRSCKQNSGHQGPVSISEKTSFVRSRKVSKPRDLYLELSGRSEIWQALRQQCCRCACQISKRYDNLKYQSRGFETLRDLTERRLFGYWDGAQVSSTHTLPGILT